MHSDNVRDHHAETTLLWPSMVLVILAPTVKDLILPKLSAWSQAAVVISQFFKKMVLAKLAVLTSGWTLTLTIFVEVEIVKEETAHTETFCWRVESANHAQDTQLSQTMVTLALTTHVLTQEKSRTKMVSVLDAKITLDQTTLEELASIHAQMLPILISLTVNARSAQDSIELMSTRETVTEILAQLDKSMINKVSANHAQLVLELFSETSNANLMHVTIDKSWPLMVLATLANHTLTHQTCNQQLGNAVPHALLVLQQTTNISLKLVVAQNVKLTLEVKIKTESVAQTSALWDRNWQQQVNAQTVPTSQEEMVPESSVHLLNADQTHAQETKFFKKMELAASVITTTKLTLATRNVSSHHALLVAVSEWQEEDRSWLSRLTGWNVMPSQELMKLAESADQTHAPWDKNSRKTEHASTAQLIRDLITPVRNALKSNASLEPRPSLMELNKTAHHSLIQP